MRQSPDPPAANHSQVYPSPPRVHWALLLLALVSAEALAFWLVPDPYRNFAVYAVAVAWPLYLCIWVRKIDHRSSSLYWAIASLVTGFGFLFSWLLWIVVIYELREELLEHYNRREPVNLRLNWLLTFLGSFVYFQFESEQNRPAEECAAGILRTRVEQLCNRLTPPPQLCSTAFNAMHKLCLIAIACRAAIVSAPASFAPIPAIRISNHINRAGKA